uniref:Uncharacterized protein n=1 Tax=Kwoniella dejecticola CBS 10117 TaxID=1296121 RepID=A0A1A6A7A1_9TREE|nr:uncharacterized protein I303_03651 [Kwoniella dejecticola CBS 10117]OBR85936.1 hypothetical protein I303_03651 [Kwoniella dejecticola CBS 10117]
MGEFKPTNTAGPRTYAKAAQAPTQASSGKRIRGHDPSSEEIDSVVVHELHWWTNDQAIVDLATELGFTISDKDVQFQEHKVNGKSKGQAMINCHPKENALKLHDFFQADLFQGKKIPSALAATAFGNPLHPGNQGKRLGRQIDAQLANPIVEHPTARPLSSAIHSAVRTPTNSHGGVNFNRVRPNSRNAIQSHLGVGHPNTRTFTMGNFNPLAMQGADVGGMVPVGA